MLGPDVMSFVTPTSIQLYVLLSPYLCFISILYLGLYVLGDKLGIFHVNLTSMCIDPHQDAVGAIKHVSALKSMCLLTIPRGHLVCGSFFLIYV